MRAQTKIFGEATGARELFKKMTGGMKGRGERTCSRWREKESWWIKKEKENNYTPLDHDDNNVSVLR